MLSIPANVPHPHDMPGFLLWQKANQWEKFVNTRLEPFGVSHSEILQLIALVTLLPDHDEITQIKLAEYTGTNVMTLSKIIRSLEGKGLVLRSVGQDSRSKAITLTSAGEELLIASTQTLARAHAEFFPEAGRRQAVGYLHTLT